MCEAINKEKDYQFYGVERLDSKSVTSLVGRLTSTKGSVDTSMRTSVVQARIARVVFAHRGAEVLNELSD